MSLFSRDFIGVNWCGAGICIAVIAVCAWVQSIISMLPLNSVEKLLPFCSGQYLWLGSLCLIYAHIRGAYRQHTRTHTSIINMAFVLATSMNNEHCTHTYTQACIHIQKIAEIMYVWRVCVYERASLVAFFSGYAGISEKISIRSKCDLFIWTRPNAYVLERIISRH